MSAADLNAWYSGIAGQIIDVDGAFPGECHDVALSWMYHLGITPGDGHAPGIGWTDQVWRQFPNYRPGLAAHFTKHDASDIRRGDIVYWYAYAGVGGLPHVAVATGPAAGGVVRCITQNPREVHIEDLSLTGVLGVLRPRALASFTQSQPITPESEEDEEMANHYIAKKTAGKQTNAIFNPVSGFFHEFESADGKYNTNVLKTFGVTSPSSMVSASHYDAVKRDCAAVRHKAV